MSGPEPHGAREAEPLVAPASAPAPSRTRKTRRRAFKKLRRRIAHRMVVGLGPAFLRALSRTWKVETLGAERFEAARTARRGHFVALWHGRMVVGLPHHGGRDWHVLVSPSEDGDISESLLEGFRYRVVRGSSSRGGARALREMLVVLDRGGVLVITPDGPRGPRHSTNPGLAWMARATGYPIVPVGFACDRAWRAKSWDRFTIPKPGARVVISYGAPVEVARGAQPADLEAATERIRLELIEAERRAFAHLGAEPDW
jgi:lysophospholipid acyltransferase (LPLAT)-like uncharacterized protein